MEEMYGILIVYDTNPSPYSSFHDLTQRLLTGDFINVVVGPEHANVGTNPNRDRPLMYDGFLFNGASINPDNINVISVSDLSHYTTYIEGQFQDTTMPIEEYLAND